MSFDDLISLFLFLIFIVVPILSRAGRGRKGPTAPQPTKGQSPRPAQQTGRSRTGLPPGQSADAESVDDAFGKRLEEARRRVREAMETQTSQGRSAAPQQTGAESAGDLFQPPSAQAAPKVRPGSGMLDRGEAPLVRERPRSTAFLPPDAQTALHVPSKRDRSKVAKPLQVQRSVGKKRAKLQGRLLSFGESDLMRGIIWKQILDEPRAKQSWRQQSQHR